MEESKEAAEAESVKPIRQAQKYMEEHLNSQAVGKVGQYQPQARNS